MATSVVCIYCGCLHTSTAGGTARLQCTVCGQESTVVSPADTLRPLDDRLPKTIGRYEILGKLGTGSFGVVFRAVDPTLKRDVAIKVPHGELVKNPSMRERLLREPQAAARLRHPNIVPVYDAGNEGDVFYIVSGFVAGRTLEDTLADGRFTPVRTAAIVAAVAEALEHAHRAGIIHRDVKPANVMLDPEGEPHLMDFGVAHLSGAGMQLTRPGMVLGTPAYMPPEQARGEPIDALSDQYSLGVMLFELLTGRLPFTTAEHLFREAQSPHESTVLQQLDKEAPSALAQICRRAMKKRASERFANCLEMAEALHEFVRSRNTSPPRPKLGRRIQAVALGAVALLLLGLGIGVVFYRPTKEPATAAIPPVPPPPVRPTATPKPTLKPTPSASASPSTTGLQWLGPKSTPSAVPTASPTVVPTTTKLPVAYASGSPVATAIPSPTPTPTVVPRPAPSPTPLPSPSPSPSPKPLPLKPLPPQPAVVAVDISPPTATITVDDPQVRISGSGSQRRIEIPFAENGKTKQIIVKAVLDGYLPLEQTIAAKSGQNENLSLRLRPVPPSQPAAYQIEVQPPDAVVVVSGKGAHFSDALGRRTIEVLQPDGKTEFEISATCIGYQPQRQRFIARSAETRTLSFRLEPLPLAGAKVGDVRANSLDMRFVLIPDGEFPMGSPATELGADGKHEDDESPQHAVKITKPFFLAVHEVTRGQFAQFARAQNFAAAPSDPGGAGFNPNTKRLEEGPQYTWSNTGFPQTDEHPVVNVSYFDAVDFCTWLSKKEGRQYRLPTEAEWEYACRAGTTSPYYNGSDREALADIGNVADGTAQAAMSNSSKWTCIAARDGHVFTAPVGQFKPNPFGLYDMTGNVWEWCSDWYAERYYRNSPPADPPGEASGQVRVMRGGSWFLSAAFCRSATRNQGPPEFRYFNIGFRVVLVP